MTKITHIFKTYFPETNGGLEEAIRQIGKHAIKEGYQVEVVAVGKKSYDVTTEDGITAKFYKSSFDLYSNPVSFSFISQFRGICDTTDILHFHFTWPTAEVLNLLFRCGKPIVVTFHCDIHKNRFLKALYLPIVKQFLKQANIICVTSRNLFGSTPYLDKFKYKTQEICLWFDEKRFLGLPKPAIGIRKFIKPLKPYALFVGVLRWYKGLDVLLDASKTFNGDIVIVGKGPLYSHLRKRIKQEHLLNVHLMGFQPDNHLKFLIQACKFITLPSTTASEAFGQILLEGLFFSKPLISTALGTGTSLVNRHNHTGIVVKAGSRRALCDAMNSMLADPCQYDRFVSNTFPHYLSNFTEAVQGEKYSRIYRLLL